jgi:hypothetical protein
VFNMLPGLIFLLIVVAGRWSIDARMADGQSSTV